MPGRPRFLAFAFATALALVVAACIDSGSWLSVHNDTDRTYVARVGDDQFLVVPPKTHLTVAAAGFTGPRLPAVQLLDADCTPVGDPTSSGGTLTISASGTVTFAYEASGEYEVTAQSSRFCAGALPGASPSPSPIASDTGPS